MNEHDYVSYDAMLSQQYVYFDRASTSSVYSGVRSGECLCVFGSRRGEQVAIILIDNERT